MTDYHNQETQNKGQQELTLSSLGNSLPENYLNELVKVSNEKAAKELGRVFFTYKSFYDGDSKHPKKLATCSISSIMNGLVSCAQTGLWPDPAVNYVYFYSIGNKAIFKIGYQGLMKLMCKHSKIKFVNADVVRKDENFDFTTLAHERSFETLNNDIIGAYAVAYFTDGGHIASFMGKKELETAQSCAPTQNVWKKWREEMSKKSVMRRLSKMLLPQLTEEHDTKKNLKAAIEIDNKEYDLGTTIETEYKVGTPDELLEIIENE